MMFGIAWMPAGDDHPGGQPEDDDQTAGQARSRRAQCGVATPGHLGDAMPGDHEESHSRGGAGVSVMSLVRFFRSRCARSGSKRRGSVLAHIRRGTGSDPPNDHRRVTSSWTGEAPGTPRREHEVTLVSNRPFRRTAIWRTTFHRVPRGQPNRRCRRPQPLTPPSPGGQSTTPATTDRPTAPVAVAAPSGALQLVADDRSGAAGQAVAGAVDRAARPRLRAGADRRHGGLGEEPGDRPGRLPGGGVAADHRPGDRQRRRGPDGRRDRRRDHQPAASPTRSATSCSRSACRPSWPRWRPGTWRRSAPTSPTPSPRWSTSCSTSPKLATVWNNANATAHTKFVQIMQGTSPGKLHTVNVDLSSAVTADQAEAGDRPACPGRRRFPTFRW